MFNEQMKGNNVAKDNIVKPPEVVEHPQHNQGQDVWHFHIY